MAQEHTLTINDVAHGTLSEAVSQTQAYLWSRMQ